MNKQKVWDGPSHYQIKVKGPSGCPWSDWFEGMTIESEGAETTITGKVSDQSALLALLIRVRDLGLPISSVNRVDLNDD